MCRLESDVCVLYAERTLSVFERQQGSFQLAEVSGKTVKETAGGASENPSAHSAVLGTFSDSGSPLAHKRPIPEVHRVGAPKLLEELVTGREVTKGARVKLSNAYVSEIKKTGSGHVHYSLIGINGVVSMIGADKQACQVPLLHHFPLSPSLPCRCISPFG